MISQKNNTESDIHINIAMENVILTFLVSGWILRELVWHFDVEKCSNIKEAYLRPKHIFRSPKLIKNFNATLHGK